MKVQQKKNSGIGPLDFWVMVVLIAVLALLI